MQTGESISPSVDEEEEDPVGDKTPVKIRCILLFDGTGNNKTNIQSRMTQDDFYRKTISLWSRLRGKPKGDDSYENGLTNVAALDTYMSEQPADDYDITILVYTEGAGTRNNQSDKLVGYGFGTGVAGVKKKCDQGIVKATNAILAGEIDDEALTASQHYIEKLHLDVFGFSRGAATARYAIYKLLLEEEKTIKDILGRKGFDVMEAKVRFAGLFDTVSSHGISFSDDVSALHLDAVSEADAALHLVAADEYRKNFSLTTIKSAGGKGIEYYMPGAHSDVGGSYAETSDEDFGLYSGSPEAVKRDARQLVDEGWYLMTSTQQEMEYREVYNEAGQVDHAFTRAKRSDVTNAYSQIPLKLMAKYAREQDVPIKSSLEADADQILVKHTELQMLDGTIYSHMASDMAGYNRCTPLLNQVRNRHLHMSAKDKIGMGPRFDGKGEARRRIRRIYEG